MAEGSVSSSDAVSSDENTSSGENIDETLDGRRARVRELVRNIGLSSKKLKLKKAKNKVKKAKEVMKAKKEVNQFAKPVERKRGQGRYTEYKIQIGWLHYRKEKETKGKNQNKYTKGKEKKEYPQVTARKGGGIRMFHYPKDEPQTVEHLIEYGKSVFFPGGKNEWGNISEMEVKLSTHNGNVIEQFINHDGTECSLQEYLKCMGIYSSQFFVYLRTKDLSEIASDGNDGDQKSSHDIPENSLIGSFDDFGNDGKGNKKQFKVKGESPGEIYVRYTKSVHSVMQDEESFLNNFSMEDCYLITSNIDRETDKEDFNPLNYGYRVTAVRVNEKVFLDLKDINSTCEFEYPLAPSESTDSVILHSPNQIVGIESSSSNQLVLGVIMKPHNSGAFFSWFCNDELYASGIDLCLVPVKMAGKYHVHVTVNNASGQTIFLCPHVEISEYIEVSGGNASEVQTKSSTLTGQATDSRFATEITNSSFCESSVPTSMNMDVSCQTCEVSVQSCGNASEVQPNNSRFTGQDADSGFATEITNCSYSESSVPTCMNMEVSCQTCEVSGGNASEVQTNNSIFTGQVADSGFATEITSSSYSESSVPTCMNMDVSCQTCEVSVQSCGNASEVQPNNSQFTGQDADSGFATEITNCSYSESSVPTCMNMEVSCQTCEVSGGNASEVQTNNSIFTGQVADSGFATEITSSSYSETSVPTYTCMKMEVSSQTSEVSALSVGNASEVQTKNSIFTGQVADLRFATVITDSLLKYPEQSCRQSFEISDGKATEVQTNQSASTSQVKDSGFATHSSFQNQEQSCSESASVKYQESVVPRIQVSDIAFGDLIGQGAFGKVYKGEWLGTTVAVKEVLVKRINIVKPMIERELSVHSRIRHPCIVQLMAVAVSKNKLYLVTEYVDGSNLDDLIFSCESSEAISPQCKLEVAQKIVQAVTYLHNQCPPILHRDIKPENILISGDLSIVRLCDMGLSKLKTMNTVVTTIATSAEMQPGTPAYQPPEVLVHRQKGNVQSDIWSLSCTLLELFAEVPVWDMEIDGDYVQCIVGKMKEKRSPDGVSKLVGKVDVPLQIVDTIIKGLDYDPENRPSAMSILKNF